MFGLQYHRAAHGRFVVLLKNGRIKKEGRGLAFVYNRLWENVVEVPTESKEIPFILKQMTSDFQEVGIEGHLTFKVADPLRSMEQLDFTVLNGNYATDDWIRLPDRLLHIVGEMLRRRVSEMTLADALHSASELGPTTLSGLRADEEIEGLGIEVFSFRINGIKAAPETARALEARERERILQDADEAVFRRRNASVEQERLIKENELNTELAVRDKEHELMEKRVRSEEEELAAHAKMDRMKKENDLSVETTGQKVVALQARGMKLTGEAEADRVAAMMKAYNNIDPRIMDAIKYTGMSPVQLLADGFRELAKNNGSIGQLNVTPEVLQALSAMGKSIGLTDG